MVEISFEKFTEAFSLRIIGGLIVLDAKRAGNKAKSSDAKSTCCHKNAARISGEAIPTDSKVKWICAILGVSVTCLLMGIVIGKLHGVGESQLEQIFSRKMAEEDRAPKVGESVSFAQRSCEWKEGSCNPNNPNLVAGKGPGVWKAVRPGYVWQKGTDKDVWVAGLTHPVNEKLRSDKEEGVWISICSGYVWDGGTGLKWKPNIEHPQFPHVFSSETEGSWHPEEGYGWIGDVETGDYNVKWISGKMVGQRKTGRLPGEWLRRCRSCYGKGRKKHVSCDERGQVTCKKCKNGKVVYKDTVPCTECSDGKKRCPNTCVSKSQLHFYAPGGFRWPVDVTKLNADDYYVTPCEKTEYSPSQPSIIMMTCKVFYNVNYGGRHGYWTGDFPNCNWTVCPDCNGAIAKKCPLDHVTNARWSAVGYIDCEKCESGVCVIEKEKDCMYCDDGRIKCNGCDSGAVKCSDCDAGWVCES